MREIILNPQRIMRWTIIFIVLACIYFLKGFFAPVLTALIIGFASWPIYSLFISKEEKSFTLEATIATLTIILLFIIPLLFFSYYTTLEIKNLASYVALVNEKGIPKPSWLSHIPGGGVWVSGLWTKYLSPPQSLMTLTENILTTNGTQITYKFVSYFSNCIFDYFLSIIFMLIALFFFYRDGLSMSLQLDSLGGYLLPVYWEKISRIIPKVIRSTFVGMTVVAIGEGLVLGSAYWIAGVPSYTALGVITAVMAMIPGGAPVSFTAVSIYLVIKGSITNAILLFSWGAIELFIVDKTLRPFLVGGPIRLPFLPTFFGLVGGVRTMGVLGLFIGPVIMALMTVIWKESILAIRENNLKRKPTKT
ncbi:AI-2E family transporter [Candidatus Liberibacter solanacearum]|uniref:AI-2E family transporter n=1 Tax=Candidatus Liberibacter solanacearum TaxID=556287 RepID=A0A1V2N7E8_9HYPH|nr:AI-2E family transporter [Candidatus Liberibacter solanacearum]ONI58849.1 AI-2E family transporter [Candidatus Liberibacter solanacearum]ONI59496.1 AI-2E family transporter [Candidatus Liberibacter solanacearum]